ncbi:hypothetical protein [Halarchaeum sp. P4]|uniref:hypothetical protein n=1 Tax=Halarchaeum sp. P4 TaxID=3421639 RepID=UPI003EC129DC
MRHRLVLALGALAVLAMLGGCSSAGSLELTAVNDTALAEEASHDAPPLSANASDSPDGPPSVVTRAIVNGSVTAESRSPRVESDYPFEYDGNYYTLTHEAVAQREATAVDVTVDYDPANHSGSTLAYADLPSVDRRALESLLLPGERQTEGYDVGASVTYTDAQRANSTFDFDAGTTYVLAYEGERYRLRIDEVRSVELTTYRYETRQVAESPEAYARALKADHLFTLTGLSDAERSVVTEARNGTYYATDTDDAAFRTVLNRFRNHSAVHREHGSGEWVVEYDGQVYWAELSYGGFTDE